MNNHITSLIGNTPLVELKHLTRDLPGNLFVKVESRNPGGSVKDRMAVSMIRGAIERGDLQQGGVLVESTSGNTGIALAMIASSLGYFFVAVMPESMSVERRKVLQGFGAKVVLTPAQGGMAEANRVAQEIAQRENGFWINQFSNEDNPKAHFLGTGPEITRDLPDLGAFVTGVGTGGTITGVGEHLRLINSNAKIIAVEPMESPVLSGGNPSSHGIQGIGAGFIPPVLQRNLIDEVLTVSTQDAIATATRVRKECGFSCGISSGANIAGALKVAAREEFQDRSIVTLICDTGDRYLSTDLFKE